MDVKLLSRDDEDERIAEEQHAELVRRRARLADAMRHPVVFRMLAESDAPNPFIPVTYGRRARPMRERIGLAFTTVTLVPIRVLMLALVVLSAWFVASVQTIGLSERQLREPLAPWRARLQWLLRQHMRAALFALGYVYIRSSGQPAPRRQAPILVCNHHGFIEALCLGWATGASFVGAAETLGCTGIATLSAAMQAVLVRRSSPTSRMDAHAEIRARALSNGMPRLVIFPEGTTTNGRALIVFKPGAFAPGVAVQPVTVRFPPFDPKGFLGLWGYMDPSWVYGNPNLAGIALGLMARPVNRVEMTFLPVYTPNAAERADAKLFAANVREVMAAALRVPMTGHSLGDVALQREARVLNLPVDKAVVEMEKLSHYFELERGTVEAMMKRFAKLDRERKGELTLSQWLSGLAADEGGSAGAPAVTESLRPELEAVFGLLDVNESGRVSFREWLLGLLLVNAAADDEPTSEDALRFAWTALAGSLSGELTRAQVMRMLRNSAGELSEQAVAAIFDQADDNKDGRISYAEFAAHASERPELLRAFVNRLIVREPPLKCACVADTPAGAQRTSE